jgi:hypothetical protein
LHQLLEYQNWLQQAHLDGTQTHRLVLEGLLGQFTSNIYIRVD